MARAEATQFGSGRQLDKGPKAFGHEDHVVFEAARSNRNIRQSFS